MFVDSDFYKNVYYGNLNDLELEKNLRRANAYIDTLILRVPSVIPDEVKFAVCEIADAYADEGRHNGIVSKNNDGYSVTYDKNVSFESKLYDIAVLYLAKTGLLYCGNV